MKVTKENVLDVIDIIRGIIPVDCDVRSYSGRGMYGLKCLGVVLPGWKDVFKLMYEIGYNHCGQQSEVDNREEDDEDVSVNPCFEKMMQRVETDNMGTGIVVYFPYIPWHDPE